jgi:hypothetical protein
MARRKKKNWTTTTVIQNFLVENEKSSHRVFLRGRKSHKTALGLFWHGTLCTYILQYKYAETERQIERERERERDKKR